MWLSATLLENTAQKCWRTFCAMDYSFFVYFSISLSLFFPLLLFSVQFSRSVVSDSVQLQKQQPTRLRCPWDPPGKNTGVGCHFLLQCMKVKSESEVAQSCPTLSDPMDCSLPGSSARGIFQARVLEWGAIAFSKSYSRQIKKRNSWESSSLLLPKHLALLVEEISFS